jgi:hypothetical protein
MKLNPDKCTFGVLSGILLGYMVSYHGIDPNLEKVSATTKIKPPIRLHDVQKLMGCVAVTRHQGTPFLQAPKEIGQVPIDLGGTRGLQRLEEVSENHTHSGGPRTPQKLTALHIPYN